MLIFLGVFQKYWSYKWIIAWHIKTEPTTAKRVPATHVDCQSLPVFWHHTRHKTRSYFATSMMLSPLRTTIDSSMIRTTTLTAWWIGTTGTTGTWEIHGRESEKPCSNPHVTQCHFPTKRDFKPSLGIFLCSVGWLPLTTCCCSAWTHFLPPHCGIALSTAQVQKSQGPGIARLISGLHFPRFQKRKTQKWRMFVHSKPLALPSPNFRPLIPNKSKKKWGWGENKQRKTLTHRIHGTYIFTYIYLVDFLW